MSFEEWDAEQKTQFAHCYKEAAKLTPGKKQRPRVNKVMQCLKDPDSPMMANYDGPRPPKQPWERKEVVKAVKREMKLEKERKNEPGGQGNNGPPEAEDEEGDEEQGEEGGEESGGTAGEEATAAGPSGEQTST